MIKNFETLSCKEARVLHSKNINFNPCLLFINNNYYKINNWEETIKIFYYYTISYQNKCLDKFVNTNMLHKIFISNTQLDSSFVKVDKDIYVRNSVNWSNNYIIIFYFYKMIYQLNPSIIQLFITDSDIKDNSVELLIYDYNSKLSKRKPRIRKAKYLINKINKEVLSPKEKFIIKFNKLFDKTKLLGDINFDEDEKVILHDIMDYELRNIISKDTYLIKNKKIFALGIIQYSLDNYNGNSFWTGFKKVYGYSIPGNKQTIINNYFEEILKTNNKAYDDSQLVKIENVCMHNFVVNTYTDKFFKYLFDFWKLDLKRVYDNANLKVPGTNKQYFNILIEELTKTEGRFSAEISIHTSIAIKQFNLQCKKRIRKYLRIIDECFWDNKELNYNKNRLDNRLKDWIEKEKGDFKKELKTISEGKFGRGRSQTMLSTPIINLQDNNFKLFIPRQRFIDFDENVIATWHIYNEDKSFEINQESSIIMGKSIYYSEEFEIDLPKEYLFDCIHLDILYGETIYAKFKIDKSFNRFFNNKGFGLTSKKELTSINNGLLTTYSIKGYEPKLLYSIKKEVSNLDDLIITDFELENGDIVVFYDNKAIQVGKKLEEGYIGNCIVEGVNALVDGINIPILNKLPKILFKCKPEELAGCGLLINNKKYRIADYKYDEVKFSDNTNPNGYFIDLNQFVNKDNIYDVFISIPRNNGNTEYKFLYINEFNYEFIDAPYVFKDFGEIKLSNKLSFDYSSINENYIIEDEKSKYVSFKFNEKKLIDNIISNGKLNLDYKLFDKNIHILFDIPVLYWQFDKVNEENWKSRRPQDLILKKLPKKLYVKGPFDFTDKSNKLYVDDYSINEDSETEVIFKKDSDGNYYCDIKDFYLWINREEIYRKLYLRLLNVNYDFCNIICKSIVLDKQIIGDFKENKLYGYFDIQGDNEYFIDIYKGEEKILEEITLENGKFSVEYELEAGKYKVCLYEVEYDEFDFLENQYDLATYNLNLVNLLDLKDSIIYLDRICDKDNEVDSLNLSSKHYIYKLEKLDYDTIEEKDYDLPFWQDKYKNNLENLIYYKGVLNYYDEYNNSHFICKVMVVFYNNYNVKDLVILKRDKTDCQELEYEMNKSFIVKDSSFIEKNYRYKNIITLDDDLYDFIIDIEKEEEN